MTEASTYSHLEATCIMYWWMHCNDQRFSCTCKRTVLFLSKAGGLCMDAIFLRKTFALIAKGLVEKEQLLQKEPTRYPYSKALQHGINMFLAASHQIGGMQDITQYAK